jgi:hypothetical protein
VASDGFALEENALRRWLDSGSGTSRRKLLSLHHCNIFTQTFSFIQHLKVIATTLKSLTFFSSAILQIVFTILSKMGKKDIASIFFIFVI